MRAIGRLLRRGTAPEATKRDRLAVDLTDVVVYAIGDVHGCHDELLELERRIAVDARQFPARKLLIMLGDYVDRGPASSAVVDHLLAPAPTGFERICLLGNHDLAMLDYLESGLGLADWERVGAAQTLLSYGLDRDYLEGIGMSSAQIHGLVVGAVPADHVAFLRSLPIVIESERFIFVHAGIRPGVEMARQVEDDFLFIRSDFVDSTEVLPKWVVHGHTPVKDVRPEARRLDIDTAAYHTGRLTAVRIWRGHGVIMSNLTPLRQRSRQ